MIGITSYSLAFVLYNKSSCFDVGMCITDFQEKIISTFTVCTYKRFCVASKIKDAPIIYIYDTASISLSSFILNRFMLINLLKSDVPCALKTRLFQRFSSF